MLPDGKMGFLFYLLLSSAVRVFNCNSTKDFEVTTLTFAFDVAYTRAVTSGGSATECITIIDIQSKQIKKIIPVDSKYYGIGVTSEGKLICSAAGNGIHLINPNNSTIDIIRDKIPRYCCVATLGDNIYHTNNQTYSVTCYDLQGTVKWKFQNEHVLKS